MKNSTSREKKPPEVFYKKGFPKNFAIFTGKHLCWNHFFNSVPLKSTPFTNVILLRNSRVPLKSVFVCDNFYAYIL